MNQAPLLRVLALRALILPPLAIRGRRAPLAGFDLKSQGLDFLSFCSPLDAMNQHTAAQPQIDIKEFRERYPQLFADPGVDEIYCDSGWKEILIALCDTLQDYLGRHPEVAPVTVAQVKTKFGELHFFYDGGDAYCRGAVDVASQLSTKTCSYCGAPGKQVGSTWISTLCSAHDGSNRLS